VKLGGINTIPDSQSVSALTDPRNPTIVMGMAYIVWRSLRRISSSFVGADVIHPAPGSEGRPSFTALVGSVDSNNAKYVATCRVQTSRKEIIEELKEMAKVFDPQYALPSSDLIFAAYLVHVHEIPPVYGEEAG